jgi:ABC-type transporter MlaC component
MRFITYTFFVLFTVSAYSETIPADVQPAKSAQKSQIKRAVQIVKDTEKDNPAVLMVKKIIEDCYDIQDLVNDKDSKFLTPEEYKTQEAVIFSQFSQNFDYRDVCEKALKYDYDPASKKFKKDHWAGRPEQEKMDFVKKFRDLLEVIVYPMCGGFFGDKKIVHEIGEASAEEVHVKTKIILKKKFILADWYIKKTADKWLIYDISVEGERWTESFRSQFADAIEKKSYDELASLMVTKKNEYINSKNSGGADKKSEKNSGKKSLPKPKSKAKKDSVGVN